MRGSLRSLAALCAVAAAYLLTGPALGALIINDSFEADRMSEGQWTYGAAGWTSSNAGIWNPTPRNYPPAELPGNEQVAWVRPGGYLSQVLDIPVTPGTTYTLQVDVGRRIHRLFSSYSIQLWSGDTLLAEDVDGVLPALGSFATSTISFTAGGNAAEGIGAPLEIRLNNLGGGHQVNFDNVRLSIEPVPAPGALGLLGLAGILGGRRRRRA